MSVMFLRKKRKEKRNMWVGSGIFMLRVLAFLFSSGFFLAPMTGVGEVLGVCRESPKLHRHILSGQKLVARRVYAHDT